LTEIQILSLDTRKEAYFCKPVDDKKPNQCKVVNLAGTGQVPYNREAYAAASTVYTFERASLQEPAVTTLMFVYGGEPSLPSNSEPYQLTSAVDTSETPGRIPWNCHTTSVSVQRVELL
jgi:hypothetical protein